MPIDTAVHRGRDIAGGILVDSCLMFLIPWQTLLATRRTHMTHENHRTDLAVSGRNGQANFAGQQYGDGSSDFNGKPTEKETENIVKLLSYTYKYILLILELTSMK